MYFFTSDEHLGHGNIIKYCKRPFQHVKEMDEEIIKRFNEKVTKDDITIHGGDFSLHSQMRFVLEKYVSKLNGNHIFIRGSHDKWMDKMYHEILEKTINGQVIVVSHYAMRVWPRSHYGSWQLYGHSHGGLPPVGKQWDIGVDNNNFYPVSFDELVEIMKNQPDNFNLIKKEKTNEQRKC